VGIEGGDQHRPLFRLGALDGAGDHGLVPPVKSIEIAERDDAPAKRLRNRRAAVQPLHAARYRRGGGERKLPPHRKMGRGTARSVVEG
jgi:hypothetical protein